MRVSPCESKIGVSALKRGPCASGGVEATISVLGLKTKKVVAGRLLQHAQHIQRNTRKPERPRLGPLSWKGRVPGGEPDTSVSPPDLRRLSYRWENVPGEASPNDVRRRQTSPQKGRIQNRNGSSYRP